RRELARVAPGGVRVFRRDRPGASAAADGPRGEAPAAFRGAAQGDARGEGSKPAGDADRGSALDGRGQRIVPRAMGGRGRWQPFVTDCQLSSRVSSDLEREVVLPADSAGAAGT